MTLAERMKGAAAAVLASATATTGDDSDEDDGSQSSRASDGNVPAISQEGDDWATITTGTAHGATTPAPTAGGGSASGPSDLDTDGGRRGPCQKGMGRAYIENITFYPDDGRFLNSATA